MSLDGHAPATPGRPPSAWLVPSLTFASAVNIVSARALPVFLPLVAVDIILAKPRSS